MLFHAGGESKEVGTKDNIFGWELDLVDKEVIRALADSDLFRKRVRNRPEQKI